MVTNCVCFVDIYKILYSITAPTSSKINSFWMGQYFHIVINDVEAVHQVLSSKHCINRPDYTALIASSKGLIYSSGDVWRHHRKAIQPAFNEKIIQSFDRIFNECSKRFVKNIQDNFLNHEFDIYEVLKPLLIETTAITSGLAKDFCDTRTHAVLEHFDV